MSHRLYGTRQGFFLLLTFLSVIGCQTPGTAQIAGEDVRFQGPTESFDLVIYGTDFDAEEHEVFLRTNLDYGGDWVSIGTIQPGATSHEQGDTWTTSILPGISTERFLGQDFRESYLDVRIVTRAGAVGSSVSALYALPHAPGAPDAASAIHHLIETDPLAVERHSIASHVQPSPRRLEPGTDYVEHVRAPMPDALPGVMEVKQLQVEWRNRDG